MDYQFKHYKLAIGLVEARRLLANLNRSEDDQLRMASPNIEMRSEVEAEARGITRWVNYDKNLSCNKPKHWARDTFLKTPLGWMQMCCAKELGLERLPNTYIQPTEEEIYATFEDRKHELGLIVNHWQKIATAKSVATKKLMAQAKAKELESQKAQRLAKKLAMTPQEILDKKIARAEKRATKLAKEALLVTIESPVSPL